MGFLPKKQTKRPRLCPRPLLVHIFLCGAALTGRAGAAMTNKEYVIAELIIGTEIETAALAGVFARHKAVP